MKNNIFLSGAILAATIGASALTYGAVSAADVSVTGTAATSTTKSARMMPWTGHGERATFTGSEDLKAYKEIQKTIHSAVDGLSETDKASVQAIHDAAQAQIKAIHDASAKSVRDLLRSKGVTIPAEETILAAQTKAEAILATLPKPMKGEFGMMGGGKRGHGKMFQGEGKTR